MRITGINLCERNRLKIPSSPLKTALKPRLTKSKKGAVVSKLEKGKRPAGLPQSRIKPQRKNMPGSLQRDGRGLAQPSPASSSRFERFASSKPDRTAKTPRRLDFKKPIGQATGVGSKQSHQHSRLLAARSDQEVESTWSPASHLRVQGITKGRALLAKEGPKQSSTPKTWKQLTEDEKATGLWSPENSLGSNCKQPRQANQDHSALALGSNQSPSREQGNADWSENVDPAKEDQLPASSTHRRLAKTTPSYGMPARMPARQGSSGAPEAALTRESVARDSEDQDDLQQISCQNKHKTVTGIKQGHADSSRQQPKTSCEEDDEFCSVFSFLM